MKGLPRITTAFLIAAGGVSLTLLVSAFVVQVPVRVGSHDLVRSASGAYAEVPVPAQTYFQKYGVSELLVLGLGLLLVLAVANALRIAVAYERRGARRVAWGLSVACLLLGVIGSVTIAPYLLVVGILLVLSCGTMARGDAGSRSGSDAAVPIGTARTR